MLSILKKSNSCLGVYINANSLDWCRVEFTKGKPSVVEYGSIEFNVQKSWEDIASRLKEFVQLKDRVIVGLPPSKVIVKNINVSTQLNNHTIIQYLQNNGQQIFKEEACQLNIDFTKTPIDKEFCELQVAACKQDLIDLLQKYFTQHALNLWAVEPALSTLSRLVVAKQQAQSAVYIFVDNGSICCCLYYLGRYLCHTSKTIVLKSISLDEMVVRQLDVLSNNYPQAGTSQIYLIVDNDAQKMSAMCLSKIKAEYVQLNSKLEVNVSRSKDEGLLPSYCVLPACLCLRGACR